MILKFTAKVKGKDVPEFLEGLGKGVVLTQEVKLPDTYNEVQIALCVNQIKANILRDNFEIVVDMV